MAVLSDSQIAGLAKSAGFPPDQIATAVAVALAESGGKTDALNTANRNGTWDAGIWQVNSIHGYSQTSLFDPGTNAAAAFKIWSAAGRRWTPWSVYNNGRYRTYIPRGTIAAGNPSSAPPGNAPPVATPVAGSDSPFTGLISGGLWLRLGTFLLGGFLLLLGLARMTGIGSVAVKVAKMGVKARTGIRL